MFMQWLMEQYDRDDAISALQHTIYVDYNNGCLGSITDLLVVGTHFKTHHPDAFYKMQNQLAIAIKTYDDPLGR
jgi:hypothetical protein